MNTRNATVAVGDDLKEAVRCEALRLGADLVGFAPVERWDEYGEVEPDYRPRAILPQARSVVVVAVPMLLPVIDSTPSINYQEMYDTSNRLLDEIAFRLATWLMRRGYPSIGLPRDGYASLEVLLTDPMGSFSHVFAGKYAGLGTIGTSHNLLGVEYGPRLRLNSILTEAEIPGDAMLPDDLCTRCNLCEKLCPAKAICSHEGKVIGDLDKDACTRQHIVLRDEGHWPCGVCAKVCPIGADRRLFGLRGSRRYLDEWAAIEANSDDPRYGPMLQMRRHGSRRTPLS